MIESPYRVPHAVLTDGKNQSKTHVTFYVCAILASVLSIGLGLVGTFVIPIFMQIFVAFNTNLPAATLILISNRMWLWTGLAMVVFLLALTWRTSSRQQFQIKITISFAVLCAIEIYLIAWIVSALYGPIFEMGKNA